MAVYMEVLIFFLNYYIEFRNSSIEKHETSSMKNMNFTWHLKNVSVMMQDAKKQQDETQRPKVSA